MLGSKRPAGRVPHVVLVEVEITLDERRLARIVEVNPTDERFAARTTGQVQRYRLHLSPPFAVVFGGRGPTAQSRRRFPEGATLYAHLAPSPPTTPLARGST